MDFDLALFNGHLVAAYRFGFGFIVLDVVIDDRSTLIALLLYFIHVYIILYMYTCIHV